MPIFDQLISVDDSMDVPEEQATVSESHATIAIEKMQPKTITLYTHFIVMRF